MHSNITAPRAGPRNHIDSSSGSKSVTIDLCDIVDDDALINLWAHTVLHPGGCTPSCTPANEHQIRTPQSAPSTPTFGIAMQRHATLRFLVNAVNI
ncbi:hypothetical protein GA0061078_0707 [Bifidobacterium bohemicum]|nr:hypothetical protein GA0061078_0707 [Bifidobacterium bohemicum]